jgi:hypothetical protein
MNQLSSQEKLHLDLTLPVHSLPHVSRNKSTLDSINSSTERIKFIFCENGLFIT